MRLVKGAGFLLLVMLGAAGSVLAADYYVDQGAGNAADSNSGSADAPWETLYRAMAQPLSPGDVIHVKAGTYDARNGGDWDRPVFNPSASGSAERPITIVAEPIHSVILDNGGQESKPPIGVRDRNYIVWDGFVLPNPGDKGVAVFGSDGAPVYGITLQNLVIYGVWKNIADNTDGIRLEHARDVVVRNNRVFNVHNAANTENAAAVKEYDTAGVVVENNEFYDLTTGIYDKIQNMNNVYRNNFIHDVGESAIYFRSPSDRNSSSLDSRGSKVYGNLVVNCTKGVEILPSEGRGVYDTEIFNNTFVNYSDGGVQSPRYNGSARIYNNIFSRRSPPGRGDIFTFDDPASSIALSDYNVFVDPPVFKIGVYASNRVFTGLGAWQGGVGFDLHSRAGDIRFVDAAGYDFRLQDNSPAKGAGRAGGVDGGAVVDAGAFPAGGGIAGILSDRSAPAAPGSVTVSQGD